LGRYLGGARAARVRRAQQRAATRARVKANVAESRRARAASNFGGKPPAPGTRTMTRAQWAEQQSAARGRAYVTARSNAGDIAGARRALEPYVRRGDLRATIDRLDVSSPRDGAKFWSGAKAEVQRLAGDAGVTLETTPGGRVVDGWKAIDESFPWPPPTRDADFWGNLSKKYSEGVSGRVEVV
jgi:hypothetical protein